MLAYLIGAMMAQLPARATSPDSRPVVMEETGVATSYEATKNISCSDMEWKVDWKSGPGRAPIRGGVTVVRSGKSKVLNEAQAQLFDKFQAIENVSATCNKGAHGKPTRSALLVSGTDEANRKALAQLYVEQDFKASWSFDTAE